MGGCNYKYCDKGDIISFNKNAVLLPFTIVMSLNNGSRMFTAFTSFHYATLYDNECVKNKIQLRNIECAFIRNRGGKKIVIEEKKKENIEWTAVKWRKRERERNPKEKW